MSLLEDWKTVAAQNGYEKLSADDQEILRNVFITGAVACYGGLQSPSEDVRQAVTVELKEYVGQHRNLQVPSIN